MSPKPADVDAYLAALPDTQRASLAELRRIIQSVEPAAAESISYGMPAYKYRGKPLVYFGAAKNHWALYGLVPEESKLELATYDVSKGTIRFPWDNPIPAELVRKLVADRRARIEATFSKGTRSG
jgi:uncharacterized protein YdhG (YjbR/CyaY superfamily)